MSSSGVHRIGSATIRGVATTEYRANIDLAKAATQNSNLKLKILASKNEKSMHVKTFPVSIWLDSKGRVRQMYFAISTPIPPSALSGPHPKFTMKMMFDEYGFGMPVNVSAPPISQVANMTAQVAAQAKGAQASAGSSAAG